MSRVRSRPERPVVVIVHVGEAPALRDVRAGLEEEGVPARADRVEAGAVEIAGEIAGETGPAGTGPALTGTALSGTAEAGTAEAGPGESGPAVALAHEAARRSPLDVGVGLAADGSVCVHHAKLDPATPALVGDRSAARSCGHNAARLVVGIPFKDLPGG